MGGSDNESSASSSSTSSTATTAITDSYNTTSYETNNLSNTLSEGATMAGAGASVFGNAASGSLQAGGNIRSNIGNVYMGSGPSTGGSGGIADTFAKYGKWIVLGIVILLAIHLIRKHK